MIVSAKDVTIEDKDAPKGLKEQLDSYAGALGRSAWLMSLKCGCDASAVLTSEAVGDALLKARIHPLSRGRRSGYPSRIHLSGFSRIERKTHETLRILQKASVSRQQRQPRQQQDQAAMESQSAGSARRDKRQRAANPGLHAMYPLGQGQEERVARANTLHLM